MREAVRRAGQTCPVEVAVTVLGGSWKLTAVKVLLEGTIRSAELARRIPNAPARSLTRALRELEADGIVERTIYPEVPPHVEYSLTPQGQGLTGIVAAMDAWGQNYLNT